VHSHAIARARAPSAYATGTWRPTACTPQAGGGKSGPSSAAAGRTSVRAERSERLERSPAGADKPQAVAVPAKSREGAREPRPRPTATRTRSRRREQHPAIRWAGVVMRVCPREALTQKTAPLEARRRRAEGVRQLRRAAASGGQGVRGLPPLRSRRAGAQAPVGSGYPPERPAALRARPRALPHMRTPARPTSRNHRTARASADAPPLRTAHPAHHVFPARRFSRLRVASTVHPPSSDSTKPPFPASASPWTRCRRPVPGPLAPAWTGPPRFTWWVEEVGVRRNWAMSLAPTTTLSGSGGTVYRRRRLCTTLGPQAVQRGSLRAGRRAAPRLGGGVAVIAGARRSAPPSPS
jgi:hypothetical protein